ncbi:MAG: N-acetylmuramoyl-L-alanine amidase [Candidatus Marinimicrobia bacterium]|nr:N-acetylmuramoyl-L-alanine amidase [Candidatus Neomarinimicrobiota bacterium]MBL7023302.1 N-acetylmuramoyl-L-alanine amidase [Candidatus Neomarinimicrobiota bacterium]
MNIKLIYNLIFLFSVLSVSLFAEQKKDPPVERISLHDIGGINYISALEFAQNQSVQTRFFDEKNKLELNFPDNRMLLSAYCSFVLVGDNIHQISRPVIYDGNDFFIPAKSLLRILNITNLPDGIVDSSEEYFVISAPNYNIHSVQIERKANGSLIRLRTSQGFNLNTIAISFSGGGWMSITIPSGKIDSLGIVNSLLQYPISQIRCMQSSESAQISFRTKSKIDDYEVFQTPDASEIIITLRIAMAENANKIKEMRNKWLLDTIVIDPGHGGKDPGAIGYTGIHEKTITLDIAKKLGKKIRKNMGVKVIYTRDEDVFIPLWKRTKIANESGGKVFLSIHVNSTGGNKSARGFETYLLRPGKTEDAIGVAQRENSVITLEEATHEYTNFTDENIILATMAQSTFMKESEHLAEVIQTELDKILTSPNRGVKQAGFHVLVGASMPNVLIEVGFLSNKKECKLLGKSSYRKKIAEAIYRALIIFKDKYESTILSAD